MVYVIRGGGYQVSLVQGRGYLSILVVCVDITLTCELMITRHVPTRVDKCCFSEV
jgi:hypothetical protein